MPNDSQNQIEYVQLITGIQRRLYAYILTLEPTPQHADDILQEANLVLWKKIDSFEPGTNFNAWAHKIAYFQVKAFHKKKRRQNWLQFDDSLTEKLAESANRRTDFAEDRHAALRQCIQKLPEPDREVLRHRYDRKNSISEVAELLGRTRGALKQALYRIRGNLKRCVQTQMAD